MVPFSVPQKNGEKTEIGKVIEPGNEVDSKSSQKSTVTFQVSAALGVAMSK